MNEDLALSPLTGQMVRAHDPYETEKGIPQMFRFEHTQDGFDDFRMAVPVLSRIGHNRPQYIYEEYQKDSERNRHIRYHSVADTEAALNLVRGYLWRSHHQQDGKKLVVTTADGHNWFVEALEKADKLRYFIVKPMEEFIQEAQAMTFVTIALNTLRNLSTFWKEQGLAKPFVVPCVGLNNQLKPFFRYSPNDPVENGMCFGASKEAAPYVYEYLLDEGFIRHAETTTDHNKFVITSKGFAELDKLAKGKSQTKEGFLVRRYDPELDLFLDPVMREVSAQLLMPPIEPVWAHDHNDRIDERIFRKIKEAAVVVVHLSVDRYNVGLEHGYAMALDKPIVLIREKPKEWVAPPFDIATQNCYDYEPTEEGKEALVRKLVARVGLALDLQKTK